MTQEQDKVALFKEYFSYESAFKNVADSRIKFAIEYSLTYVDLGEWSTRYRLGWLFLSAHHLYIRIQTSKGQIKPIIGALTGVSTPDVTTSYNASGSFYSAADDALLMQTQYGAEYVQMRNATIVSIFNYD